MGVRLSLLAACAIILGVLPQAATADEDRKSPSAVTIGEVVVTARRVPERLQRTPAEVAVIGAADLSSKAVRRNDDLKFLVPGLEVAPTQGGGQGASVDFAIRGMFRTYGTDPVVQTYVNEVPVDTIGLNYPFFDLASVQVLKGPQGVAFGRNATAGAVLFETNPPVDHFEASLEAGAGNLRDRTVDGVVNLPLARDRLVLRVAANYETRDGVVKNVLGHDVFDRDHHEARVSLRFQPSARLVNDTALTYAHSVEYDGSSAIAPGGTKVLSVVLPATGLCQFSPPFETPLPGLPPGSVGDTLRLAPPGGAPGAALQYCLYSSRDASGAPVGSIPMTPAQLATYGPLAWFEGTGLPGGGPSAPLGDLYFLNQLLSTLPDRVSAINPVPRLPSRAFIVSNTTRYDLGETPLGKVTLKNLVGYSDSRVLTQALYGPPVYSGLGGNSGPKRSRSLTEEFQVLGGRSDGSFEWLAGVFLGRTRLNQAQAKFPSDSAALQTIPLAQLNFLYDVTSGVFYQGPSQAASRYRGTTTAAYGRIIWRLFSAFDAPAPLADVRLTAGYRITHDRLTGVSSQAFTRIVSGVAQSGALAGQPRQVAGCGFFFANGAPVNPNVQLSGPCEIRGVQASTEPTWEIGLDDQITDHFFVYAKRSKGYKQGGLNGANAAGQFSFGPETVVMNEIGVRADWRAGPIQVRTNATWYRGDYDQIQDFVVLFNPFADRYETLIRNQQRERVTGWSLDVKAAWRDAFSVSANYQRLSNYYLNFRLPDLVFVAPDNPNCRPLTPGQPGGVCARVPASQAHNTYAIDATYRLPVPRRLGEVLLSADYFWQGRVGLLNNATGETSRAKGYDALDASLAWRDPFGAPGVITLWCRNVADRQVTIDLDGRNDAIHSSVLRVYPLEPRTWGVTLRREFR